MYFLTILKFHGLSANAHITVKWISIMYRLIININEVSDVTNHVKLAYRASLASMLELTFQQYPNMQLGLSKRTKKRKIIASPVFIQDVHLVITFFLFFFLLLYFVLCGS